MAKQIEHPSLGATLLWTLILSGPILTGLLMGVRSNLHIILIAVSSALMAIDWVMYIRGRSRRKEYQKERDKGSLWIFAVLIVAKVSDKESIKYADYDEECMQNFKRIMEVQNEEN